MNTINKTSPRREKKPKMGGNLSPKVGELEVENMGT